MLTERKRQWMLFLNNPRPRIKLIRYVNESNRYERGSTENLKN